MFRQGVYKAFEMRSGGEEINSFTRGDDTVFQLVRSFQTSPDQGNVDLRPFGSAHSSRQPSRGSTMMLLSKSMLTMPRNLAAPLNEADQIAGDECQSQHEQESQVPNNTQD